MLGRKLYDFCWNCCEPRFQVGDKTFVLKDVCHSIFLLCHLLLFLSPLEQEEDVKVWKKLFLVEMLCWEAPLEIGCVFGELL